MKKLIIGLLAAFLMSAGLVTVSSTSATAACPYTNCIATKTTLTGPKSITAGKSATFTATVDAVGSNAVPKGKFTFRLTGPGGFKVTKVASVDADGKVKFTTKVNKAGKYKAAVSYTSPTNSVFKNSASSVRTLTVKKKR